MSSRGLWRSLQKTFQIHEKAGLDPSSVMHMIPFRRILFIRVAGK